MELDHASAGLGEGQRCTTPTHRPSVARTWAAALARVRGCLERWLEVERMDRQSQRWHDAGHPLAIWKANGGRTSGRAEALGFPRAVPSCMDASDGAVGARHRPMGGGNLVA